MLIPPYDPAPEIAFLKEELDRAIQQVLTHGRFILGPEVEAFEQEAAGYLGVNYAIGVNSGTDALVIAMRAAGIGEGDEVITTPFSFFATAESISIIGAKPVFVDIEEDTFNLDPAKIEAAITPSTKAIVPVHLYGRPAAMASIMHIARQHNLKVIEDCAQSFGAAFYETSRDADIYGKQTGAIGDAGAFSFFPTKNLGGFGDGGLITTNSADIADMARMLRTHGSKKKYHNEVLGYNSRLDTLQAALLQVKLKYIDTFNGGRRKAAMRYNNAFEGIEKLMVPQITQGHVFHQYTLKVSGGERDRLRDYLKEHGIGAMVYYPVPQDKLPVYEGQYSEYPVSDRLSTEVLSLPVGPFMEEDIQQTVIDAVQNFWS